MKSSLMLFALAVFFRPMPATAQVALINGVDRPHTQSVSSPTFTLTVTSFSATPGRARVTVTHGVGSFTCRVLDRDHEFLGETRENAERAGSTRIEIELAEGRGAHAVICEPIRAPRSSATPAVVRQNTSPWASVCPTQARDVSYCRDVGKDAYNATGAQVLRDVRLGQIIGVSWRPKGSLISLSGNRLAPRSAYYYIIDDGSARPFVRQAREISAR